MFHRIAWATAILVAASPAALAQQSWAGKTILLKSGKVVQIHDTDADGREVVVGTLKQMSYRVLEERRGRLKVRDSGVAGWFDKDDAVALEDAVDYFSAMLQVNAQDVTALTYRGEAWLL